MLFRFSLALLIALVAALLAGWLAAVHPLLEAVANARAHLFPIALIALGGLVWLRRWPLAAVAGVLLAVCLSYVIPYWTASPDQLLANGATERVLQYNIFFGNNDATAIAAHIDQADAAIVVLHEVTPQQWADLEPLLTSYPHHIAEPLDASQGQLGGGMVMLSRAPLERIDLPASYSPADRVVIAAVTTLLDERTMVVGLHPFASRHESRKASLRQEQLHGVADLASSASMPVVILADLNVTPTSPQYQNFVHDLGWRDPHRIVGWQSSWPTWGSFGFPIDHVFVSNEFALHAYELGDGAGSDHRSLVADISLTAQAAR